jgi:uncharacterized membrane protein
LQGLPICVLVFSKNSNDKCLRLSFITLKDKISSENHVCGCMHVNNILLLTSLHFFSWRYLLQTETENYEIKEEKRGKTMGPVDYLIVRFVGNKFNGKMVPELADLEKRGIIRVIDLVMVIKDSNGKLFVTEAKDLQGDAGKAFQQIAKNTQEWFYQGDIETIASALPNNSSAALLLYENVWAIKFKEALRDSEAELIDMGRIAPEIIAEAEKMMNKGGA